MLLDSRESRKRNCKLPGLRHGNLAISSQQSRQKTTLAQWVRNFFTGDNSAPPKWSKLWTDAPKPGDRIGAYTPEQFEQMNQEFTAAVERAFRSGGESFFAASRTYDVRRRAAFSNSWRRE